MGGVDRGDQLLGYIIAAGQKVQIHLSLLVGRGNHKLLHSPKEFLPKHQEHQGLPAQVGNAADWAVL